MKTRSKKPVSGRKSAWRVTSPDPAVMGPLLRQCGFIGDDADPLEVKAHFDRAGRPRRIHATYPNGWRATLNLRADKTYSLSQAIKFVSRKPAS